MGEIFIRPLPATPLPFTGERLTSELSGETEIEHLHRYLIARELCRGKQVLDVASGEGYGSALLAQVATSVIGVELAADAVDHARNSYKRDNLKFVRSDAREMAVCSGSVDVVVSFETIEHFAEQELFLREIRRVLRAGGLLIVSTPDRDNYSPVGVPANPYHVLELTHEEFGTLLSANFAHVHYLMQRPMIGSIMLPASSGSPTTPTICFEKRGEQHFEASRGLPRPRYVIAIASDAELNPMQPTVYIDKSHLGSLASADELQALRQALAAQEATAAVTVSELHQQKVSTAAELAGMEQSRAALRTELDESLQLLSALRLELDRSEHELSTLRLTLDRNEHEQSALRAELSYTEQRATTQELALSAALDECRQQLAGLYAELDHAKQENIALKTSTSWRVTAPLRSVKELGSRASVAQLTRWPFREPRSRVPQPAHSPPIPDQVQAPPPQDAASPDPIRTRPPPKKNIGRSEVIQPRLAPISVVVPTYNRSSILEDTLRRCSKYAEDVDIELVVIDDGSTDDTPSVLARLENEFSNLIWRRTSNRGPGAARNFGASIAKHEVILFLGDDIQPIDSSFFYAHSRLHALDPSTRFAVLGKVTWPYDGIADVNFIMAHIQGHGGEQFAYAHLSPHTYVDWRFFYTSNVSVKRAIISDWLTDGFQPRFVLAAFEDIELAYRLYTQPGSFRIYYDPTSIGQHVHPYTLHGFLNRQMSTGLMAKVFVDLHPEVAKDIGVAELIRALSSPSTGDGENATADFLSLLEGLRSWARILERNNAFGRAWWHDEVLTAVFEATYLQGFLMARTESSSNFSAGYKYILTRCLQCLRKTIHHELTGNEAMQHRLGFAMLAQ